RDGTAAVGDPELGNHRRPGLPAGPPGLHDDRDRGRPGPARGRRRDGPGDARDAGPSRDVCDRRGRRLTVARPAARYAAAGTFGAPGRGAIFPAVIAGALLGFSLSFDEYVVTTFNSGLGSSTLPLYIYGKIKY